MKQLRLLLFNGAFFELNHIALHVFYTPLVEAGSYHIEKIKTQYILCDTQPNVMLCIPMNQSVKLHLYCVAQVTICLEGTHILYKWNGYKGKHPPPFDPRLTRGKAEEKLKPQ